MCGIMYCVVVRDRIMADTTQKLKYIQLADHLRERIRSGELKVGDRLPSYAEMYREHGATSATMQRVCDVLEQENLIERRHSSGVYVAEPRRVLTGNIGFIGSAPYKAKKNPFYMHLMDGVQQAADAKHQHLLYLGTDHSWDVSACAKIDGLLLCNIEDPKEILDELPPHLPCISLLTILDGLTCVGVDDYRGAQMAVRHLLSLGHRRIACLMEKLPSEGRRRFAGYHDALLEAGIEEEPGWVRLTDTLGKVETDQPYREWASLQMRAWLQEGWKEAGCTAILVQNEIAAIGVIQVLQKEGIRVPEDVSVMGFDGTEICDLISPRLCAVTLPLEQIGAKAMEIINQQIGGEKLAAQAITLPVSLRAGESVALVESALAVA